MLKSKEETKLLSDDDFERVGRRMKTVIFIIVFIMIMMAAIPAFMLINKRYIDSDTNEETIDVPAGIIISNREFGLVITSEEAKKNKKTLAYIADKDKLKKIYDLLGI